MSIIEERGETYGPPEVNLVRTADLWAAFLGFPVSARDVAMCMALVKVSRIRACPTHSDSYLDARAYLEIAEGL